ncbi:MAG: N5,N10-methylene tetrahydromethanopterin reductase [Salinicola sp.]|uniref:LLM class flavin-dependent oxidoreductase n=1 Tax=uncultured Salinicola sp. TaxID=1193542 RepID=UPI000C8B494F|nr:LLM class flavin-dependent oxidoreductase [uncultured Salinicola sp.]MAM57409.1 N5,N10-methylene tetrahydromethanopterin reductase [Salinicola sp.]
MSSRKPIRINAFNMNCVGHIHHGLWSHPRDRSGDYRSLAYWTELAQLLERGLFDALFLADILGAYDVFEGSIRLTAEEAVQLPVNDPFMPVSAMAAVTRHLGFGLTANLSHEPPYLLTRRLSTLDHLTEGRIGWNVVTGYLDSAARAMGQEGLARHDERYDRAEDYLALTYRLWEGSWEDDAVPRDRERRVFSDPTRIHPVAHEGPFYRCNGYHLCEPSPQRSPVIYQAGSSRRGRQFAARHAEAVFISGQDRVAAARFVAELRRDAAHVGRDPADIKVFPGISVVVDGTRRLAEAKYRDYARYASPEAGLAHFSSSLGVDLSRFALDEPIDVGHGNAIQSAATSANGSGMTRRKLLESLQLGSRYPVLVGNAADIADALESWIDEADVDGFNLTRIVTPESYADFIEFVVPELQRRGRYRTSYEEGTLRHKLFGRGDRLPIYHPAAASRR